MDTHPISVSGLSKTYRIPVREPGLSAALKSVVRRRTEEVEAVRPLSLMPEWVQLAATALPFRWMVAFPVELLLGRLSRAEALTGLAVQAIWLVLALAILSLCWQRAAQRDSAVGA